MAFFNRNLLAAALCAALGLTTAASTSAEEITVAVGSGFTTLDPYDATDLLSRTVSESFYEGLFIYDKNMKVVPQLAESYEMSPDGLVYTVKLKSGVKFHDGTMFDAEAVKKNVERVLNPDNHLSRRNYYTVIDKVEVVDPLTVRFVLKHPMGTFLNRLATGTVVMVCPKSIDEGVDLAFKPCGTGPYVMKDYNPSERLHVVKNPDYRVPGLPKLDGIIWRPVIENATRAAMVRTGEAAFAHPMPAEQIKVLQNYSNVDIIVQPSIVVRYLFLNNLQKPFTDPRVRQAINYAINKEALAKVAFSGYARPVTGVVPEKIDMAAKTGPWPYDPKKARELLKEAGYPQGFETELWSGYNNTTAQKAIQFIQQQLRQVGIKTTLRSLEAGQRVALVESVQDPMKAGMRLYYIGWSNSTAEVDLGLRPLFHSESWAPVLANEGFYKNPDVDRLLDDAIREPDEGKRRALYGEVQQKIWQDAPWAFLVTEDVTGASSKKLKNFRLDAAGGYDFYEAELVK